MSSLLMPGEISLQNKVYCPYRQVLLSGPFSSTYQICKCLTVQPQNFKASTVPAVQTNANSLETRTVQLAHQLTKSMKHRGSLGFCIRRITSLGNYICVLVTVRLNIDRDR